jgi:hypothetical protein
MILSTEYATFRDYTLEDRTIAALAAAAAARLHPAGSARGGNRASAKPMTGVCHPKAIRICFRLEQFKEVS